MANQMPLGEEGAKAYSLPPFSLAPGEFGDPACLWARRFHPAETAGDYCWTLSDPASVLVGGRRGRRGVESAPEPTAVFQPEGLTLEEAMATKPPLGQVWGSKHDAPTTTL